MMTPRDFCYWLNGFLEVSKCKEMTNEQTDEVRKHLSLVFQDWKLNYNIAMSEPYQLPTTTSIDEQVAPIYSIYNEFINDVPASC